MPATQSLSGSKVLGARGSSHSFPSEVFFSGFQEEIVSLGDDWAGKLKFWQFGLSILQKLEAGRFSAPEPDFEKTYEGLLLILLTMGYGLKVEIPDSNAREHLRANLDNLNSKYITLKMPCPDKPNRLLQKLAA